MNRYNDCCPDWGRLNDCHLHNGHSGRVIESRTVTLSRKKQFWNRVDCQRSEKKIQNTQERKITLFNWTKQDKTCKFSREWSFSNYVQHKNRKKQLIQLILCQFDVEDRQKEKSTTLSGGWQKEQSMRLSVSCPFPSARIPHPTYTREVELIVCLHVAWKRGLPRKFARFVLFLPIKKRSFNLLLVLDLESISFAVTLNGCSALWK